MVLYAGHGEFPRAVFAPGTVEECFYLTHHAFGLAEQYQTPMFVLTDQFLADSYRAVLPPDIDDLPELPRLMTELEPDAPVPYKRYALSDDGVSPRLVPGFCEALVRADSHEHDEQGRITEDAANRVRQNVKRLDKGNGLMQDVIGPDYYGEDGADVVLMCWGSSLGACLEAAETLNAQGSARAAVLHFSQVYPLREEQFMDRLEAAGQVVAVEGNATAQFARLVARETGFTVSGSVLRFDGRPLSPEYVLKGLESII
jgi:2-oxoglutarate ferredoxin oxidoreductase subunit alpha